MNTAIITGASQGIGKATAILFAQKGYDVVLAARQQEDLEIVAEKIRALGTIALAIPTDITDRQQVKELVAKALNRFTSIDVLVNNAGICMMSPMTKTTHEDWQKIINTNLWGYIYTIETLLPHFLERKRGTIINVGSFGGKMPLPNMTAYCTSKYAVTGLTETLRLELEPKGIYVCGIHPSVTNSDFLTRAVFRNEELDEDRSQRQQLQQMLDSPFVSQPEEVAREIFKLVQRPQAEVIVGSGAIATTFYRLFPSVTQWLIPKLSNN